MKLLWVVVVGVLVASCGGKQQPESPPGPSVVGNEAPAPDAAPVETVAMRSMPDCSSEDGCGMRVMRYFRDEMCGCASRKDKDCAQRVTDDMTKWAQDSAKSPQRERRWGEEEMKEMEAVGRQLGECTTKAFMPDETASAYNSAPPSTPPGRQTPVGPPPGPKPGCASSKQGTTHACAMNLMTWYADAMCACTTKQCAQDLTDDMTKWAQDAAKTPQSSQKVSEADSKKMEAIGMRLGECMSDVMMNTP
jgi:hypothetical protein